MSVAFQDKIIYVVVFFACVYLFFPSLKKCTAILKTYRNPDHSKQNSSIYSEACEKCSVKK